MAVAVTLSCGCRVEWDASASAPPTCPRHATAIVHRVQAPPPRFRGPVTGPCAGSKG